jgi:hypothetical protein|tara:strand:- start:3151 stop:3321 length:171 start_codon:yes stop_codon:yes gene_type:complete
MSNKEWLWMDDLNEEGYPLKKIKRIKNEIKRNKAKNNSRRTRGGDSIDKGGEGADY